jgi:HAD superfamily hydrolase (TIGR01509 family)
MKKCIIFDCDGVLVDSEIIANRIGTDELNKLGYNLDNEQSLRKFIGLSDKSMQEKIQNEGKVVISNSFFQKCEQKYFESIKTELKPLIEELLEFLQTNKVDRCIASNGTKAKIKRALEVTNQIKYFDECNLFSAEQVIVGKPAPDLFLLAAENMGYKPEECLVIEDSAIGMQAAMAAKINVIAFLGATHTKYDWYESEIKKYNMPIVYNVQDLIKLVKSYLKH